MPLTLLLACGDPPADDSPAVEHPYTVVYTADGLPDCAASLSDEALCGGFVTNWGTNDWAASFLLPEWLWRTEDTTVLFAPAWEDEPQLCVEDSEEALARYTEVWTEYEDTRAAPADHPLWVDLWYSFGESSHLVRRIPRCSVYAQWASVASLYPGSTAKTIDPIWTFAEAPDRLHFVDTARMLETGRKINGMGSTDLTILYALGVTGDDTTWTFRTCRIDGKPTMDGDRYAHVISQNDYVQDVASRSVRYTATPVRTVTCDETIRFQPDW